MSHCIVEPSVPAWYRPIKILRDASGPTQMAFPADREAPDLLGRGHLDQGGPDADGAVPEAHIFVAFIAYCLHVSLSNFAVATLGTRNRP